MAWRKTNLKTQEVFWSLDMDSPVSQNGYEFLRERVGDLGYSYDKWNHSAACPHPDHRPDVEKAFAHHCPCCAFGGIR